MSSPSVRGGPQGYLSVIGAKLTSSWPALHSKSNPSVWSARSKSAEALLDGICSPQRYLVVVERNVGDHVLIHLSYNPC